VNLRQSPFFPVEIEPMRKGGPLTDLHIADHRLRNQRLTGTPFESLEDAVRWLTAVQAQDYYGAKWGLAQRVKSLPDARIDDLFNQGKILRTHVMRPTWHFVLPADIRWLLKLTAPRVNAVSAYVYRQFELDEALFRRSNKALVRALRGGKHLTRAELALALSRARIEASGVRLAYLILRAELDAVLCSGALRGKQFTYALLDERVPQSVTMKRDEALAELTKRYFTGHGPALLQDYSWWSGLGMADAKRGIELAAPQLNQETVDGKTWWFGSLEAVARQRKPTIHLLPNYDEYLIAYKYRDTSFDPALQKQLLHGNNVLAAHLIVLNGRVIGGWRRKIEKNGVTIDMTLLTTLNKSEKAALRGAVDHYARFLKKPAVLQVKKRGEA
jgi:hypothetical protein